MKNKTDIEKIKLLLPDYVTGTLSGDEALMVKNAIDASEELKNLYLDMKNALEFAGSVKYEEPASEYWNNLLPRIHEKIDEREQKSLAKNPLSYIWKVLVPVAAVILIFVVYRISFTPNSEISEKEQKNTNKEKVERKDTVERKNEVEKNIEKQATPKLNEENIASENNKPRNIKHHRTEKIQKREDLANKTNDLEKTVSKEDIGKINNKVLASLAEVEEFSIFDSGTPGTLDEDTENELDKLNKNEQDN
jgi:hypothetical protein